jgi:CHAT domain-containing protein
MAVHDSRTRAGRSALAPRLAIVGLVAGIAIATMVSTPRASGTEQLVNALLADRFTAGRLSAGTPWRPCEVVEDSARLVPKTKCDAPRASVSLRISDADSSPQALRGRALVLLRSAGNVPEQLQESINMLRRAVDSDSENAALRNELAVALLKQGEQEQKLDPMLHALNEIEWAYAMDPKSPAILFNLALIRQRMYLVQGAEQAWTRYIKIERDRRWRTEAEHHLRDVRSIPDTISWAAYLTDRTLPRLDEMGRMAIQFKATVSPQIAREFCFPLLQEWGKAQILGDSLRAERLLAVAREIGEALEADSSIAYAVDAIDDAAAAGDTVRLHNLAHGHVELALAFRFTERGKYDLAEDAAEAAERQLVDGGSTRAALWAAFYDASSEINQGQDSIAEPRMKLLIAQTRLHEPVLRGKAVWALGLIELRNGKYGIAEDEYRRAEPYIIRSMEIENRGTVGTLLSEAFFNSGNTVVADSVGFPALRQLSPYRRSKYLANQLNILAGSARNRGLTYAALALNTEAIKVFEIRQRAELSLLPNWALFYSQRALDYASLKEWEAAGRDVRTVDSLTRSDGDTTKRALIHPQLYSAQVVRLRDPAAALPLLRSVVKRYREKSGEDLFLPIALYEAGLAAQATGRIAEARDFFAQGVEHVEAQRADLERSRDRARFYETVENLFDAWIALEIQEGERDSAFAALERGRVPIWAEDRRSTPPTLNRIRTALPDSTMLVEYALLRDSLIIWTVTRDEVRHHVVLVSRRHIAELAERVQEYDTNAHLRALGSASERLHNLLILPMELQLREVRHLVIVRDRELNGVSFAGLSDRGGKLLIESHAITTVPSAAFYLEARQNPIQWPAQRRALIVGNPEVDTTLLVDLEPLGGAEEEANQVATYYPGMEVLIGPEARPDRVLQLLDSATVFHFAGHAVFNPDRPEESYLALSADTPGNRGMLRAREIGNLRLSNLQVVVLSACSTLGQRATRTGPAAGLASSFLLAGVPATVSTLWDVPGSAPTELLVTFHRRLREGDSPAEALQKAQVEAIGNGMSPRAWAAFVYTGP